MKDDVLIGLLTEGLNLLKSTLFTDREEKRAELQRDREERQLERDKDRAFQAEQAHLDREDRRLEREAMRAERLSEIEADRKYRMDLEQIRNEVRTISD